MTDKGKREAIEAAGWRSGDYGDFLGLSDGERKLVELRVNLALKVRRQRKAMNLTQRQLAERVGTSQARIANIEAGGGGVSADTMLLAFFEAGGDPADLGRRRPPARPVGRPAPPAGVHMVMTKAASAKTAKAKAAGPKAAKRTTKAARKKVSR